MAKKLDPRRQQLKDDFTRTRGYWSEIWDGVLDLSPEYFEAYSDLSSVPWKHGTLAPKIKEFVYIAIDAATTHLYNPGTRIHIANALRHGATKEEIMEVLMIASVLGIHTITDSVPILIDVLKAAGKDPKIKEKKLSAKQQALKDEFTKNRGYWAPLFDGVLHFSPEFFKAYTDLSSVPWKHGTLEPKVKELLYVAIDASTTHLYNAGTKLHMANAVRHGATAGEIMEVLMLTACLGVHTITESVPILIEEAKKAAAPKRAAATRIAAPRKAGGGARK
jgi:alkylhydroperoxidase/carboxymuconolactone decarboxylase family protein YurZ